jgi:hypothetical protein
MAAAWRQKQQSARRVHYNYTGTPCSKKGRPKVALRSQRWCLIARVSGAQHGQREQAHGERQERPG